MEITKREQLKIEKRQQSLRLFINELQEIDDVINAKTVAVHFDMPLDDVIVLIDSKVWLGFKSFNDNYLMPSFQVKMINRLTKENTLNDILQYFSTDVSNISRLSYFMEGYDSFCTVLEVIKRGPTEEELYTIKRNASALRKNGH